MKKISVVVLLLAFCECLLLGQSPVIPRMDSVKVKEGTTWLRNACAGGLNLPEFSEIDIDQDGRQDMLIFDRSGKKMLPFLNLGTPNQVDYTYAPEYESHFPQGAFNFAVCADYNCDGKADLFVGWKDGIRAYRNTSTPGNLNFTLYQDTLFTMQGVVKKLLFLVKGDIPAFVDVDGDTDLDILAFDPVGNYVEWHKNMALENAGNCDELDLHMVDGCWGKFSESGLNQTITMNITCRLAPTLPEIPSRPSVHAGSSLAAFDEDNDGDLELVIGDLLYDGLTYVHNAGTPSSALVDSYDATFPSYNAPVGINVFPAAFFMDVNNDGKDDMLSAPNVDNISVNYNNSWYYQNIDTSGGIVLSRIKKAFLQDEMIDAGFCAFPVFFDHDNDGLLDIIVGNYSRKITSSNVVSGLVLYQNTGTATHPEFTLTDRNYAGLNTAFTPEITGVAPALGDLDADGDKDLIVGSDDGRIHFLENIASSGQSAIFSNLSFAYHAIDVGQSSTPAIIDVDRDGKNDLVIGSSLGHVSYYRNIGTPQVADFSSTPTDSAWGAVDVDPDCCIGYSAPFVFTNPATGRYDLLVGSGFGELFYYQDIESELGWTFTLDQAAFGEIQEGERTAVAGADLNNDGVWEWVVGNERGGLGFYSGNGILLGNATTSSITPLTFEVFPNPTSGQLQLRLPAHSTGELGVTITDLQGKIVLEKRGLSAAQSNAFDLSGLPSGAYLFRLERNGRFEGVRLVHVAR